MCRRKILGPEGSVILMNSVRQLHIILLGYDAYSFDISLSSCLICPEIDMSLSYLFLICLNISKL